MNEDAIRADLITAIERDNTTERLFHAARLAEELMAKHGLFGWKFGFDRAKNRCGLCRYSRMRIQMSKYYILAATAEDIEDTILHEIAHALCGCSHGHDSTWKLKAKEIGAKPLRCSKQAFKVPSTYTGKCADCGIEFNRQKKLRLSSLAFNSYRHAHCKHKKNHGIVLWFKDGVALNRLPEADGTTRINASVLAVAAQTALEGTGIKVTAPTQSQINELWERLNKYEGKS